MECKSQWHHFNVIVLCNRHHYNDVIMSMIVSQITGISIVCLTICPCTDQRKHQSSTSLAFVRGIHWWPVDSPHKRPVTQKMFPFDHVIMLIKIVGVDGMVFEYQVITTNNNHRNHHHHHNHHNHHCHYRMNDTYCVDMMNNKRFWFVFSKSCLLSRYLYL